MDPLPTYPSSPLCQASGKSLRGIVVFMSVEFAYRYRFRLISISCDPNYVFSIDGHTSLTIIEVDGVNTEKLVVDSIQVYAGQRYSFIVSDC